MSFLLRQVTHHHAVVAMAISGHNTQSVFDRSATEESRAIPHLPNAERYWVRRGMRWQLRRPLASTDSQTDAHVDATRFERLLESAGGEVDVAARTAQQGGELDPEADVTQLYFELDAALELANYLYTLLDDPAVLERGRAAVRAAIDRNRA
jgi:hypothetical protein